MKEPRRRQLADQLETLRDRVDNLELLQPSPAERRALNEALERARVQLVETSDALLTVLLVGGTGAGKSSLINALAGSRIAGVSSRRPCTNRATLYLHEAADGALIEARLRSDAVLVTHNRPALQTKVLIDTPDLDSYEVENREYTVELLKRADLVLYVFNPENYRDERIWSVLLREKRFSSCAVVLNKVDEISSSSDLAEIRADLGGLFAREGLPDVRIFATSAGLAPEARPPTDELRKLADYLQLELDASAEARIKSRQQAAVLQALQERVESVAPAHLQAALDGIEREAPELLAPHADGLIEKLDGEIELLAKEAEPQLALKSHALFRGPLRAWLGFSAMLRYGLARRIFSGAGLADPEQAVDRVLARADRPEIHASLRASELALQDRLFRAGLPLAAWEADARSHAAFLQRCSQRVRRDVLGQQLRIAPWQRALARGMDLFCSLALFAGAVWGLWALGSELLTGGLKGLVVLAHIAAVALLLCVVLHGLSRLLIPSLDARRTARAVALAIRGALSDSLRGRLEDYAEGIRAELQSLRQPLASIVQELPSAKHSLPTAALLVEPVQKALPSEQKSRRRAATPALHRTIKEAGGAATALKKTALAAKPAPVPKYLAAAAPAPAAAATAAKTQPPAREEPLFQAAPAPARKAAAPAQTVAPPKETPHAEPSAPPAPAGRTEAPPPAAPQPEPPKPARPLPRLRLGARLEKP